MAGAREVHGYILDGMARALWSHAYMVWATEVEPPPMLHGETWAEVTPDTASTRKASMRAAKALESLIEEGGHALVELFSQAWRGRDAPSGLEDATEADLAYVFGEGLAHASLGTMATADMAVAPGPGFQPPHFEVMLNDAGDEISWDGGISWGAHRNPPVTNWAGSKVQSLIFDKAEFTVQRAKEWARAHGYRHGEVDTTERFHRIRQFEHTPGLPCRTIRFRAGVQGVICATRNPSSCGCDHETRASSPPYASNPSGPEVLLIEDEPGMQKATTRMIKKILPGAEVLVADNYGAAIGNLETHEFALVVSDVNILGNRSGLDIFEWVKANQPHMVDKYVFFTGGNPQVETMHYRYLEKPATVADMKAVIEKPAPGARRPVAAEVRPAARPTMRPVPAAPAALSTADIAQAVTSVMPRIETTSGPSGRPTGRFGHEKVFIAAIWRELQADPRFRGMTLDEFKRALIVAGRERMLDLARADLVGAMDPAEVATSEIDDRGYTVHFVLDKTAKAPWER